MALRTYSKRTLDRTILTLSQLDPQMSKKAAERLTLGGLLKLDISVEDAEHYIEMARATEIDQRYGRLWAFLAEGSIGFKKFMRGVR